ncbi:piggyBac transposable element-derived protein 1 [Trichonephila clavipes]|nr:piggyBac transposable element-derived protein 1 [Trichonephila clavipes]
MVKKRILTQDEIDRYMNNSDELIHLPNYRACWSEELGFDRIEETMPLKKFETIRQYLYFNDKDEPLPRDYPNHDWLHKIRPFYDELNKNFVKVHLGRHLSIDEKICSTKLARYSRLKTSWHEANIEIVAPAGSHGVYFDQWESTSKPRVKKLEVEKEL